MQDKHRWLATNDGLRTTTTKTNGERHYLSEDIVWEYHCGILKTLAKYVFMVMRIIELVTFGEPNVEASSNSMLKLLRHSFDIMLEFIWWGGWSTNFCRRTHGCGLWRSINEGWESFSKHLTVVVGDGTHIRFWHDRWIGDNTLKDLYTELYVCLVVKDACISKVLWIPEGFTVRVWNLRFYRAFEDWELTASCSLLQLIQTCIPRGDRRDTLYCILNVKVSLTFGLTTMWFGVLRILYFLGRVFGNTRFLSVWHSFCG